MIDTLKNTRISRTLLFVSLFIAIAMLAASCAGPQDEDGAAAPLVLKQGSFRDLPGWSGHQSASHNDVFIAFRKSCDRILKRSASMAFGMDGIGGTYGDWQPLCRQVISGKITNAKSFFEQNFTPYQATAQGKGPEGLFTGYYEPTLRGSLTRGGPYQHPIRAKPDDLVMVDLGAFRDDLKGRRIAGRVKDGRLRPYEDRAAIVNGKLPAGQDNVLVWVDDPVDVFFLHIQGSGRVDLTDGSVLRLGYAGQNGHPYYAIGRELIARGHLDKDEVSLQTIRAWLASHPDQAEEVMFTNASYVFFRVLDGEGPVGGEGIALTPERSLAVDHTKIPYGTPLWVDIDAPIQAEAPIQRLMMAQDTGGAIRGAVRGDVFWGAGERAEYLAGHMKSKGRYWLLLPTTQSAAK